MRTLSVDIAKIQYFRWLSKEENSQTLKITDDFQRELSQQFTEDVTNSTEIKNLCQ